LEDLDEDERQEYEAAEAEHPLRLLAIPFGPFIALSAMEWVLFKPVFIAWMNRIFGL